MTCYAVMHYNNTVTLYIFLHLTTMYSCTFGGKGWVGRGCLYRALLRNECPLVVFSCASLHPMHCVYLAALSTREGLCGSFHALYINLHSYCVYHCHSVCRRYSVLCVHCHQ